MPLALTGAGNVTSINGGSVSSVAPGKPSATTDLDLLLAPVYHRNAGATLSAPSGWSWAHQENGNGTFGLAYKPIPSAALETATTYTFSTDGGAGRMLGGIIRVIEADLASTVDAVGAVSAFTGTTSLTMPAVTAVKPGSLLLALQTNNSGGTVSAWTPDAQMSGIVQINVIVSTSSSNLQVAQQQLASAGSTGTRTATMSPTASNSGGFMVTIAPAPGRGLPPLQAPRGAVRRAATW